MNEATDESFERWRDLAQTGELRYHVEVAGAPGETERARDAALFAAFGFAPGDFAGKLIVDVGAGPYLRPRYFRDARIVVIEPLADAYRARIGWCDLDDAEAVHAVPAEQPVADLAGAAACVMSLNAIDHAFDPERIVANMADYLAPGGTLLLSVDMHGGDSDDLHPVALTPQLLGSMIEAQGLRIVRGYLYTPQGRSYGHGYACTHVALKDAAGPREAPALIPLRSKPQLAVEYAGNRLHSVAYRIGRVLRGESRGMRRLLRRG
ncbi:MAG: methyltransferase domain-containing protein [Flavobacteriaceae bacterium]